MAETATDSTPSKPKVLTQEDLKNIKTIHVKNSEFPEDFDEEKLKQLFVDCGTVVSATLVRKNTKELRGYGFVQFENPEEAKKAVEAKNNLLVGNGRLGVVLSTSDGPREKVHQEVPEGPTLFVRQLAWKVHDKQLKAAFETFGTIKSVRVSNKGYGFVEFDSVDSSKKAKEEMHGKELEGKAIAIDFALDRPEKKKKKETEPATPEKKSRRKRGKKKAKKKQDAKPEENNDSTKQTEETKPEKVPRPRRKLFLNYVVEEEGGEGAEMPEVTEEDVKSYLTQYGEVVKSKIIRKPGKGTFIYVTMKEPEGATKAEAAGSGEIQGLTFTTKFAPPNRKRKGRRRGRGPKKTAEAATEE